MVHLPLELLLFVRVLPAGGPRRVQLHEVMTLTWLKLATGSPVDVLYDTPFHFT